MKKNPKAYIAACRARVDADLRAYRSAVGKTPSREFEARFFDDQVLLLGYMFVHRLSGIEGKDGNPPNEVRVPCNSILLNRGQLQGDQLPRWPNSAVAGIKPPPGKSGLRLKRGDEAPPRETDLGDILQN